MRCQADRQARLRRIQEVPRGALVHKGRTTTQIANQTLRQDDAGYTAKLQGRQVHAGGSSTANRNVAAVDAFPRPLAAGGSVTETGGNYTLAADNCLSIRVELQRKVNHRLCYVHRGITLIDNVIY